MEDAEDDKSTDKHVPCIFNDSYSGSDHKKGAEEEVVGHTDSMNRTDGFIMSDGLRIFRASA